MSAVTDEGAVPDHDVVLSIGGMTCASCASRVERRLNKLPGVSASVNYATEMAHVTIPADVSPDDLVAQVEAVGYTAQVPAPAGPATAEAPNGAEAEPDDAPVRDLRTRLLVSTVAGRARGGDGHDPRPAVRQLAVAVAHAGGTGRGVGRVRRSTGRRGSTCATVPPRWTR